ncbi:MAG: glutamyl-tRNA reductase [Gammaproteobacteria bacterium]
MSLLAVGVNHRTAPVELREQLAVGDERLPGLLEDLRRDLRLDEVAVLSTCNRTEVYCLADASRAVPILQWLGHRQRIGVDRLLAAHYLHADDEAARHMMRVAAGLDSLVLGEPQVFGQLKEAYAVAHRAGTVGRELERCFQQVFAVAKRVRTETAIGANPVSVAYAAVSLARHLFSNIADTRALLIGAGEMIELVARHLAEQGVREITVANRTLARAHVLADRHGGRAITLEEIPWALEAVDVVISCTASPVPVLGKGTVERVLRQRRHRPLFMVDLAVPRDIEPEIGQLADVYLHSIDDLRGVIDENVRAREAAAREAELLVEAASARYLAQQREQDAAPILRVVRGRAEQLREAELAKALADLQRGTDPSEVLARMSRALTNKWLHQPSVVIREAAAEGRDDMLYFAQRMLADEPSPGGGHGDGCSGERGDGR